LLGCKSENRYQFNYYSDDHFRERQDGLFDLDVNYESPNKALKAFEDLNEGIVVCFHRLGRLVTLRYQNSCWRVCERIRTDKRTLIAEKIADAGGNTYTTRALDQTLSNEGTR
jgi:hypothetical protein